MDMRLQGGGIKPEYEFETPIIQPEAFWYWDFNSKYTYPGAGAFLAEIPKSVLTEAGGKFEYEEVVDIVERHMKIGGYAVINTYDLDPVITDAVPGSGLVTLSWPTYGSGVLYNVYCSVSIDEEFEKENDWYLLDDGTDNSFTVSGLNTLAKYYFKVGAVHNSNESFSPVIEATTTAY
jgi:hypothetical protein